MKHQPSCLIRPHLYRIALSDANVKQLQDTATKYPELATWLPKEELDNLLGAETMGGVKLGNGCQVIHVPTYLKGLWEECERKAAEMNGSITWEQTSHKELENDNDIINEKLSNHEAVILAAGAGLLQDGLICNNHHEDGLPVQLVRGQSIEMTLQFSDKDIIASNEAILCGKYISPLPALNEATDETTKQSKRFVIGATHEFMSEALETSHVVDELKKRSYPFASNLWDNGEIDRITTGVRMQSNRGKFGRMPIIGKFSTAKNPDVDRRVASDRLWIFTGLSSRGLIYHGLFGRILAEAVSHDNEVTLQQQFQEFDWWRQQKNHSKIDEERIELKT